MQTHVLSTHRQPVPEKSDPTLGSEPLFTLATSPQQSEAERHRHATTGRQGDIAYDVITYRTNGRESTEANMWQDSLVALGHPRPRHQINVSSEHDKKPMPMQRGDRHWHSVLCTALMPRRIRRPATATTRNGIEPQHARRTRTWPLSRRGGTHVISFQAQALAGGTQGTAPDKARRRFKTLQKRKTVSARRTCTCAAHLNLTPSVSTNVLGMALLPVVFSIWPALASTGPFSSQSSGKTASAAALP